MAKIYAELIRKGYKTIDDVPVNLREEVLSMFPPKNFGLEEIKTNK